MAKNLSRNAKRAGFTLITALAFSLVVGTVLAGVGTVALSHFDRSKVEGTYANAVAMADAGVNYEIQRISFDTTNASLADQKASPHTGAVTDAGGNVVGNFTVYVQPFGSNCNGAGTWVAPNDMCVVSKGTVNGISRTVMARGTRKSIFDEYALYAYVKGTFNGGGAASGATEIVGNMGTNGGVTFNGTNNTDIVNGLLSLNGSGASSSDPGSNVAANPDPVIMPDVSQMANLQLTTPPKGLAWLATNNNNANIRKLNSADTTWAAEPTVAGITLADVMALPSAGFTSASRALTDPGAGIPTDTSTKDGSAGPRFYVPADPTYFIQGYGVQGKQIYLVPPGDYYFTSLDFQKNGSGLVLLTHLGQIRIWIDQPSSGSIKDDALGSNVIFTDPTPSKFRLFYNKCATLSITGNGKFNGGFYAINSTCKAKDTPGMKFTGNSMIYGSVITDYFTVSGGTKVVFPNSGGSDPTDFSLWFGFKDHWKELPWNDPSTTSSNPVFADGTAN